MIYCSWCKDPFDPIEGNTPNFEGPNFCSVECADNHAAAEEAYEEGRYSAAPVYP